MGVENIRREMQLFQLSIKKLSSGISGASSLWKDEKYSELSSSIGEIASQSKSVLLSSEHCCTSIEKFNKIASEKY